MLLVNKKCIQYRQLLSFTVTPIKLVAGIRSDVGISLLHKMKLKLQYF